MSYDKLTRDSLRWSVGEIADDVHVASTWGLALQLAGVYRPCVAVLDFDRVSPQGRVLLANLLRMRHQTALVVVGSDASLADATRHGIETGLGKPINAERLMTAVARLIAGSPGEA